MLNASVDKPATTTAHADQEESRNQSAKSRLRSPSVYTGNRTALHRLSATSRHLQCKLTVGAVNDPLEHEADRTAEEIVRMPIAPPAPAPPKANGTSGKRDAEEAEVQRDETGDNLHTYAEQRHSSRSGSHGNFGNQAVLRRLGYPLPSSRPAPAASRSDISATPKVDQVLSSSGQPLDPAAREYMEPRFGHDFGHVRVHTNSAAAESAQSISAVAFTAGNNIVFNSGQYSPGTSEGRKLLAHELTHVVQQEAGGPAVQRAPAPIDVAAVADEVEKLVRPGNDEKGALDKLKALAVADLLDVVAKIYDDADATSPDEGKRRAYSLLNGDLAPAVAGGPDSPAKDLSDDERIRLKAAFDSAPSRKLNNKMPPGKDKGDTMSGSRDMSAATGPARPGDWGEDTAKNTWVAHTDGIRTYFGSPIVGDQRSSSWLGKNPSNFDYTPSFTKRAIGSFHWGTGVHHFAIYLQESDAVLDLKERMDGFATMLGYIGVHLGPNKADKNRSPEDYIKEMQRKAPINEGDNPAKWTTAKNLPALIEGFKAAEGWNPGTVITAAKLKELSADPKNADLVDYYQKLLGTTP